MQLKQLGLLLVMVVGRPLGNYIQALVVLSLLIAELLFEFLLKPQRFRHVQLMQATAVCFLVYSTMTVLLLADYDHQAAKGGLTAVSLVVGLANVALCAWFVLYIFKASRERMNKLVASAGAWLWHKAQTRFSSYITMASKGPLKQTLSRSHTM